MLTRSGRRRVGVAFALATAIGAAATTPASAEASRLPRTYVVSTTPGTLPEGITIGADGRMYVTSDGTGAIYRGNVSSPQLRAFSAEGAAKRGTSLGIHLDGSGRLYSVGADRLQVHDRSGNLISQAVAPAGPLGAPDLNDLVITRDWVYVTDWANPTIYRAGRSPDGRVGVLEPWLDIRPAWPGFPAQFWLLNGIVASPDGSVLLVASNGTEALWRVDTATRDIQQVEMDQPSFGPDGMVLRGTTLYSVINYGAPTGVYVAELDPSLTRGTVRHVIAADAAGNPFDVPTTLAGYGCRLYVVNSQNNHPPGQPPFTVSAVDDPACHSESPDLTAASRSATA